MKIKLLTLLLMTVALSAEAQSGQKQNQDRAETIKACLPFKTDPEITDFNNYEPVIKSHLIHEHFFMCEGIVTKNNLTSSQMLDAINHCKKIVKPATSSVFELRLATKLCLTDPLFYNFGQAPQNFVISDLTSEELNTPLATAYTKTVHADANLSVFTDVTLKLTKNFDANDAMVRDDTRLTHKGKLQYVSYLTKPDNFPTDKFRPISLPAGTLLSFKLDRSLENYKEYYLELTDKVSGKNYLLYIVKFGCGKEISEYRSRCDVRLQDIESATNGLLKIVNYAVY